jgi:hypothetical protein
VFCPGGRKKGACFSCGKEEHFARECQNKHWLQLGISGPITRPLTWCQWAQGLTLWDMSLVSEGKTLGKWMSLQNRYRWASSYRTGKLPTGPALALSNSGDNCYAGSSPIPTIENLVRATPGSTELDLSPISWYMLTPDLGVQITPTWVYGPLPQGTVGLILGKSI